MYVYIRIYVINVLMYVYMQYVICNMTSYGQELHQVSDSST